MTRKKLSEEHKKKISESLKGCKVWNKGKSSWNKGKPMSESAKQKLSESLKEGYKKGRQNWMKGLNLSDSRVKSLVKKRTKTVKEKGTFALENNPRWKGGKIAYKNMALKHYGRKCMLCGKEDERERFIQVHHKDKDRSNNVLENLEVLCAKCHKSKHPQHISDYQKQRASETHKGKPKSDEQKKKMSDVRKLWWKKHTERE